MGGEGLNATQMRHAVNEKMKKMHKIFAHVKKKQYLCSRFLIKSTRVLEKNGIIAGFDGI